MSTSQQQLVEAAEAWLSDTLKPGQVALIEGCMDKHPSLADHTHTVAEILHREVIRLREQLRWVPVTERFPHKPGEYETMGDYGRIVRITVYTKDPQEIKESIRRGGETTHWRPLDLPEGGEA